MSTLEITDLTVSYVAANAGDHNVPIAVTVPAELVDLNPDYYILHFLTADYQSISSSNLTAVDGVVSFALTDELTVAGLLKMRIGAYDVDGIEILTAGFSAVATLIVGEGIPNGLPSSNDAPLFSETIDKLIDGKWTEYIDGQDVLEPSLPTVPGSDKEKYFLNALKQWAIASHTDLSDINSDLSNIHISTAEKAQFAEAYLKSHAHPQTFVADSILQSDVTAWDEAYQDKHQHSNLTGVLDLLTAGERGLKFNGTYVTPTLEELGIFLVDEYSDLADKTGLLGITKTHTTPHIPEELEPLSSVTVKPILPTGAKPTGLIKSVTYLLDPDEEGSVLAILWIINNVSDGDYSFPLITFVDIAAGGTANAYGYAYSAVDQTLSLKGLADGEGSSMDFVGGQWYSYRVNLLTQHLVSYPVPSDSPPAVYNTTLYREEVGNNNCTYKIFLEDYFTSTLSTPSVAYYQDSVTKIWTAINSTGNSGSRDLEFLFEEGLSWGATLEANIITFTYPAYATQQDIEDYVDEKVPPAETPDVTKFLNEDNTFAKVAHSQLTDDESTKHLTSQERLDLNAYTAQKTIYALPVNWTLETNKNYSGVISSNPTFVLPAQQDIDTDVINIIHLDVQIVGTIAVTWGNLVSFSYNAIPSMPEGYCDIEFEWSPVLSKWNVTVKYKGVVT